MDYFRKIIIKYISLISDDFQKMTGLNLFLASMFIQTWMTLPPSTKPNLCHTTINDALGSAIYSTAKNGVVG